MPKSFSTYYTRYNIVTQPAAEGSAGGTGLVTGFIYIGTRLINTLLLNNGLYLKLGFKLLPEIQRAEGVATAAPTCLELANQSDAVRISAFRIYGVTLIPEDENKTIAPYGKRYDTRIPASYTLTDREAANVLYTAEFTFGEVNEEVTYIVEVGSAQLLRSKKTASKLPLNSI